MAKLIYDARAYNSGRTYEDKGITFTSDGYIITHGIAYNATGTATSIEAGTVVNLVGAQATGAIPYQTITGSGNNAVETTSFLEAPTTNGYVLKFNTSTHQPYWASDSNNTYKLTLNGTTNGASGGTSLGTLYAPTTAGSQYQILQSNGSGAPSWVTLITNILSTYGSETYGIPTAKAVRDAITSGFAANDAMVFAGTLRRNSSSKLVFVSHNPILDFGVTITDGTTRLDQVTNYSAGWTFRIVTEGGKTDIDTVEIGDLVIAYKDITSSTYNKYDFTVVQNNINGALTEANLNGDNSSLKRKVYLSSGNLYVDQVTRAIKVDGTQKLSNSTTTALNFISGKGITLTYGSTAGDLTIALNVASQYDSENASTGLGGIKLKSVATSDATSTITNPTSSGGGKYEVKLNGDGVAYVDIPWQTHNFYLGASGAKANVTSATSNPYLTTKLTSAASGTDGTNIVQFKGTDYLTVSGNNGVITFTNTGLRTASASVASNVNGVYTIGTITKGDGSTLTLYGHDVNTWRNVTAYLKSNNTSTEILSKSVGTADLAFGSEFLWDGDTSDGTLHIGWAEVDSSGNVTYAI